MITSKDIDIFNRAVEGNYNFKKITDSLYFAQIPKNNLGAFNLVVNDAGIYLYEYPGESGVFFELVYKCLHFFQCCFFFIRYILWCPNIHMN